MYGNMRYFFYNSMRQGIEVLFWMKYITCKRFRN